MSKSLYSPLLFIRIELTDSIFSPISSVIALIGLNFLALGVISPSLTEKIGDRGVNREEDRSERSFSGVRKAGDRIALNLTETISVTALKKSEIAIF